MYQSSNYSTRQKERAKASSPKQVATVESAGVREVAPSPNLQADGRSPPTSQPGSGSGGDGHDDSQGDSYADRGETEQQHLPPKHLIGEDNSACNKASRKQEIQKLRQSDIVKLSQEAPKQADGLPKFSKKQADKTTSLEPKSSISRSNNLMSQVFMNSPKYSSRFHQKISGKQAPKNQDQPEKKPRRADSHEDKPESILSQFITQQKSPISK